jgi:hypothetical protein
LRFAALRHLDSSRAYHDPENQIAALEAHIQFPQNNERFALHPEWPKIAH